MKLKSLLSVVLLLFVSSFSSLTVRAQAVDEIISVDEVEASEVRLSPVPASDVVRISADGEIDNIALINALGQEVQGCERGPR